MSGARALLSRIDSIERDLSRASRALDAPGIDPALQERVGAHFDTFFTSKKHDLVRLRTQVESNGSSSTKASWDELRAIRDDCDALFTECLAFLAGVHVRTAGIDGGVGVVADALLDDLSRRTGIDWGRVSVLGNDTHFNRVVEIVRLRFPEFSVWGLPAAAHEFGHVVARKVKDATILQDNIGTNPMRDLVVSAGGGRVGPFLHELFADVFATYSTGPAFLCRSVLFSFDPSTAYTHGNTHPMAAMRVEVMRRTLETISEGPIGSLGSIVLPALDPLWASALETAGQPASLDAKIDPGRLAVLDEWWTGIIKIIDDSLPATARYATWLHAQRLWRDLERAVEKDVSFDENVQVAEDDTLADVLNAAWLFRINHPYGQGARLPELENVAARWCHEIAARSHQ